MTTVDLAELRTLIQRHAASDTSRHRHVPNLLLGTRSQPTAPCALVVEPVFSLVAQGAKRITVAKQIFDYNEGQFLIVSVDLPADAHVVEATPDRPYLGCALTLQPEAIASLLLESGGARGSGDDRAGIAVSNLSTDLVDPIVRLVRLLDQPSDAPILAAAFEREILWRLINGPQGSMVRQIGLADSRMSQIGRSIRWLRAHFAETVRIEAMAEMANMSVTSLHRHFRMVTTLTPIQYQKQLRLHAARTRLMATRDNVSEVGFAVGYESASQFSREYRKMFGTSPGRDAAMLRADASSRHQDRPDL